MGVRDFFQQVFSKALSWLTGTDIGNARQRSDINRRGQVSPVTVHHGRGQVESGQVIFEDTGGSDDKYLYFCVVLCEGEIEYIEDITLDEKPLTDFNRVKVFEESTGSWVGDDIVVIQKFRGTQGQLQSTLLNESPNWAAAQRRGTGLAYLAIRLKGIQKYFPSGQTPQVNAVCGPKKVLDPRDSTWKFSANGALVVRDVLASTIYGRGLPEAEIGDTFESAADDCDDLDSLVADQLLGTPDEVVTLSGQTYLKYNSKPRNAFSMEQATLRNSGGTKIASAGFAFTSPGWYGTPPAFYVSFVMTTGGDFTTADTVYMGATQAKRLEANIDLNAGQDRETIMKNLQGLLPACRGQLPRIGTKYELFVEKDRPPAYEITLDDIVASSGISGKLPKKKNKVNRVLGRYRNPNKHWREDIVIYPEPGSAEDLDLLAQDNQVRLEREIRLDHVVNTQVATDLSRLALYKFRNDIETDLITRARLLEYTAGDVLSLTHPSPGWNQKPFLVSAMGITRTGNAVLQQIEFEGSIYSYQQVPLEVLVDDTDLDDPFYIHTPENLQSDTLGDIQPDGSTVVGITVSVDPVVDEERLEGYEWQYKRQAETVWQTVTSREPQTDLKPLIWLGTYNIRCRTLSTTPSVRSEFTPEDTHIIFLDTTPPSVPVITSLTGGPGRITVQAERPPESDFKDFGVYYDTVDVFPGGDPAFRNNATEFPIENLNNSPTQYYVWLTSWDDFENQSAPSPSSTATTTEAAAPPTLEGSGPPTDPGDFVGQIYQDTDTGALYEWNGSAWVDHIPADPTGLEVVNPDPANPLQFVDDTVLVKWDPATIPFYSFYLEVRFNGVMSPYRTEPRGGSSPASTFGYSFEDAIKDGDNGDLIEDGARNLSIRLYTLSSDGFTRSANYLELNVTNPQFGAPSSPFVSQNLNGVFCQFDKPDGSDFQGVVAYAGTSPGFAIEPANLVGYYSADAPFVNIGPDINELTRYWVRFGLYDKWGRDGITLTGEYEVLTAPPGYNDTYATTNAPVYGVDGYFREGDLWLSPTEGNNQYQWQGGGPGGAWIDVQDTAIAAAQADALAAGLSADRKARLFRRDDPPAAGEVDGEGDGWIDWNDGNAFYQWVGTPPAGAWINSQDASIADAQTTADGAQNTADTARGEAAIADNKADNAQSTADDALFDANNIYREQVIPGEIVAEHWVNLPTRNYNNPADGVGGNDNFGGLTFTAAGQNVSVQAGFGVLIADYDHNSDMTDVPFVRNYPRLENQTTGSGAQPISQSYFCPVTIRNPPNASGESTFEGTASVFGSTGYPGAPTVNEGDSVRVTYRGIYYRGDSATTATLCSFLLPTLYILEFNNE